MTVTMRTTVVLVRVWMDDPIIGPGMISRSMDFADFEWRRTNALLPAAVDASQFSRRTAF